MNFSIVNIVSKSDIRNNNISIFKEDNVFSMTVNLPYGPPMNTDIIM